MNAHLAVQLTPKGLLQFNLEPGAPRLSNGQSDALADRLSAAFARGAGHGLLHLGAVGVTTALPPLWAFWRDFAARFVTALTATPADGVIAVAAPDRLVLETLCLDAPPKSSRCWRRALGCNGYADSGWNWTATGSQT